MATVYINDQPVDIGDARLNCIQAAELANTLIPSYCYHEALTVVASCRMCLIEMGEYKDGKVMMVPKVFPGCQTPVKDGTVIITGDYDTRKHNHEKLPYPDNYVPGDRAKKSQADTLEGLLINHPLDCSVCDKAGECKLQDYSFDYGRSESRMIDQKNTPPNKPNISSKITLFTDRCIMCTRCVRFTREISGTKELTVTDRGHHEEIDIFPGYPLENKLSGNVVDLCPVGALGSKDFLYKQRVWYLKRGDGVCSGCSTGCSINVDANKDIVYRLTPRKNLDAQGHFMCDEGRWGYHFTNSSERLGRHRIDGQPSSWNEVFPRLRDDLATAENLHVVLSPFLTVEEAFLYATYAKSLNATLMLGPVPIVGEDDQYPKDVRGHSVEPVKFTIRAEKCPNRHGVEAVLKHFQGDVIPFDASDSAVSALFFVGGYPRPQELPEGWTPPKLLVVQDLFPSKWTESAKYVLPSASPFEKDGTYINHAGYAQTFPRAVRSPREVRGELQVAYDLLGRTGLVRGDVMRQEISEAMGLFEADVEVMSV